MNFIAFVPLRCGSKSIPFKNIKLFCGKPLVYWNLQELQNTKYITKIVVATDCDEIEKVVLGFNFNKVELYRRKYENATDNASTESVILEYINFSGLKDVYLMLVQVTSPLTTRDDYTAAIQKLIFEQKDSLLSCVRVKRFLWSDDGIPINYDFKNRPRRQEFLGFLVENGAFYINSIANILKDSCRLSGSISIYEMPEYSFIEIDEESDWMIAENLMSKYFNYLNSSICDYSKIDLLVTDVDGVLTDAGMYYSENGDEIKKFNTRDGKGFELLRLYNVKTAIITSENTLLVDKRAKKLKVDYLVQGVSGDDKLKALLEICSKEGIELSKCAYIGDDINCIPLLEKVGYAFCPNDAEDLVKKVNNICILNTKGGMGVFREVTNKILLQK